jgi:hypothetical protein
MHVRNNARGQTAAAVGNSSSNAVIQFRHPVARARQRYDAGRRAN